MSDYLSDQKTKVINWFDEHPIPDYFYDCFFGEIVKIWGMSMLIPNDSYLEDWDDDEYTYKGQISAFIFMEEGTAGWSTAFTQACKHCSLSNLYEYYKSLDWVGSDIFDDTIGNNMINYLFSDTHTSSYYSYISGVAMGESE